MPSTFTRPLSGVNAQPLLGCIEQTQHPFATYHKTTFYTRACKVLHTPIFPFTMRYWPIANGSSRLIVTKPRRRMSKATIQAGPDPERAIRDYVRAYVWRHGRRKTAKVLGVSRHTLWRFLERGHMGQAVPSAVLSSVGGNVRAIENARQQLLIDLMGLRPDPALPPLRAGLEEALLLLCAAPLTTVDELSRLGRVPVSTLREQLEKLAKRGLVDSVAHHLSVLGTRPQRRYFPAEKGVIAGGVATQGRAHMLRAFPVSKQWVRLLAERLDAVAVLYSIAAMVADADPHNDPMRVDHYRRGPYDMLFTLSGGRSVGLLRQGPMLSTANLRYRIRSIERLHNAERPFVTLVLTHADQATRRAIRSLGDPSEHHRTFAATEGELLAGDHNGVVWQQCGSGLGDDPPVLVSPDASLTGILAWMYRLLDSSYSFLRDSPKPNPGALYPSGVHAAMPEPTEQLKAALSVLLTRAEKDALDLLAAWPLRTREQLAGLMGGVTLRRVNQVLRSLSQHGLVRADGNLHVLTDEGLTYLARRDRAAVGLTLDRWSAEPSYSNASVYAGTALRALASQLRHHEGVTGFAAALTAEVARSPHYDLFDLLPTSRSSIGYRYDWTTYVILPDASFTLEYRGRWRPYLLEFERRATTPKRILDRLESYSRYFQSGWAERDHGGFLPRVLFVFETPGNEDAFLDSTARVRIVPFLTSNVEALAERGILGNSWRESPPASSSDGLNLTDRVQLRSLYPVA